ncbi:MAG: cytidine deaminase [Rhodothermaceae bacterium]|nr:cytidine deaminase [Rhodothermaceae bacterium]MXZ58391.1 cytidine deaminase [Rhodothermaceae bacterium]MYB90146.1 cytidine deaminase [Rhodothermaceae bacterium]MYD67142.1 cytidine deaminase [Rhodothermaceae bacterium]MYG44985.1 cytidine deaminase [Rhodothermaceae bacterium]
MKNSWDIDPLRHYVQEAALRSFTPYSGLPRAALVLMSDGAWACGVRIENASYSLVIPALSSALVSTASIGRKDIVAILFSGPVKQEEKIAILQTVTPSLDQLDKDFFGTPGCTYRIGNQLTVGKQFSKPIDPNTGIRLARHAAEYADIPESNFPVGAIAVTDELQYFQGANIEYPDWTRILCAERAAIATAMSAGASTIRSIYVSCPKSTAASPCGACRQVLYEVAPESDVWFDRGNQAPKCFRTKDLLPEAFRLTNPHRASP